MNLVKVGKTKDVFKLDDGNYLLKFKDDATGTDGVFDPGANTVGLQIKGMGEKSLKMSKYFFEMLEKKGIKTQFISSDLSDNTMIVKPCEFFGNGLEVICRFKATGSFMRRYGEYIQEGAKLPYLIEMTLKDDKRNDPLATEDTLIAIGVLKEGEYGIIKNMCQSISKIIEKDLADKGLEIFDIKLEFGKSNGEIVLIDEISGGNMRVYKGLEILHPLELAEYYI